MESKCIERSISGKVCLSYKNIIMAIKQLFKIPDTFDHQMLHNVQYAIFLIPGVIASLMWRDKSSLKFLSLILSIILILFFLRSELFINFQNNSQGLIKTTILII